MYIDWMKIVVEIVFSSLWIMVISTFLQALMSFTGLQYFYQSKGCKMDPHGLYFSLSKTG